MTDTVRASETEASVSVVVPVYNGQATLEELVERVRAVLEARGVELEIVLVNDGSRDDSWALIQKLSSRHPCVRGLNLMRNYGQHNALLAGIRAAENERVVTLDDDLQHPPEEIPRLLDELRSGFDVVYGYPRREQHDLWRNLLSQVTKIALRGAMGVEIARRVSAFRAFKTHVRRGFDHYDGAYVSLDVLLTWGSTRFSAIPVAHEARKAGTSNYTVGLLARHALNMITGFSVLPLRLASLLGFFFTLFGISILVYVVGKYFLFGTAVPGFAFLASTIAIFAGVQLFALGVFGEYLARMHTRLLGRPCYKIHEVVGPPVGTRPAP